MFYYYYYYHLNPCHNLLKPNPHSSNLLMFPVRCLWKITGHDGQMIHDVTSHSHTAACYVIFVQGIKCCFVVKVFETRVANYKEFSLSLIDLCLIPWRFSWSEQVCSSFTHGYPFDFRLRLLCVNLHSCCMRILMSPALKFIFIEDFEVIKWLSLWDTRKYFENFYVRLHLIPFNLDTILGPT